MTLVISTACVPKKSTPTASTTADTDRIATLESKVSQLQSKIASLPTTESKNYDSEISDLQSELSDVESNVQSQLDSFQPDMPNIPKYALVTDIGRSSLDITVYGTGDFPIAITLYGENLKTGIAEADKDFDIEAEHLFGQVLEYEDHSVPIPGGTYDVTISGDTYDVVIPSGTYPTTDFIVEEGEDEPNAHTHNVIIDEETGELTIPDGTDEITIPDIEVLVPMASLGNTGTMLVIIVEPDDPWTNGYTFELDIRDIGTIYYATASVAYAD